MIIFFQNLLILTLFYVKIQNLSLGFSFLRNVNAV